MKTNLILYDEYAIQCEGQNFSFNKSEFYHGLDQSQGFQNNDYDLYEEGNVLLCNNNCQNFEDFKVQQQDQLEDDYLILQFKEDNKILYEKYSEFNYSANVQNNSNYLNFKIQDQEYVQQQPQPEVQQQQQPEDSLFLQLRPFDLNDFLPASQIFQMETPNFEDVQQNFEKTIHENKVFQVKKISKQSQKRRGILKNNQNKNVCRYLARQCIRSFVDIIYQQLILQQFCNNNNQLYQSSTSYYLSKIEFITSLRAFRSVLEIEKNDSLASEKLVFKHFAKWFLKERALRYILGGQMKSKKQYIECKNQIMIQFFNQPFTEQHQNSGNNNQIYESKSNNKQKHK